MMGQKMDEDGLTWLSGQCAGCEKEGKKSYTSNFEEDVQEFLCVTHSNEKFSRCQCFQCRIIFFCHGLTYII